MSLATPARPPGPLKNHKTESRFRGTGIPQNPKFKPEKSTPKKDHGRPHPQAPSKPGILKKTMKERDPKIRKKTLAGLPSKKPKPQNPKTPKPHFNNYYVELDSFNSLPKSKIRP
jgi:hypothetical protein